MALIKGNGPHDAAGGTLRPLRMLGCEVGKTGLPLPDLEAQLAGQAAIRRAQQAVDHLVETGLALQKAGLGLGSELTIGEGPQTQRIGDLILQVRRRELVIAAEGLQPFLIRDPVLLNKAPLRRGHVLVTQGDPRQRFLQQHLPQVGAQQAVTRQPREFHLIHQQPARSGHPANSAMGRPVPGNASPPGLPMV